jgi:Zn-dependent protease with chaperone function
LIVFLGAVFTLYALLRSLFIQIDDSKDPGLAVTESNAPALWAMARDVATTVGTRPVDEIWMTPGTELAVYERGDARSHLSTRSCRALLLGAGVLEGLGENAFRAILAHEYGHFSHRDTAGGDVALRVQNGMHAFAVALAEAGFATGWNLAYVFLQLYSFLFRRISYGATRLQEILADRLAIQKFGLGAFKEGLTHVIRRSLVFDHAVGAEIDDAIDNKRPLANLYTLPPLSDKWTCEGIENSVEDALNQETTEDDTHPSPKDRFRLGERIVSTVSDPSCGNAWELFKEPDALMSELTAQVATRITNGTGVDVTTPGGPSGVSPA